MLVINQLWPAGSADTRTHDRPARPTAFCWNQNCPRVCGEKVAFPTLAICCKGSPPHMRGKGMLQVLISEPLGITPAYAGKRKRTATAKKASGDHPRICGEKRHSVG